MGNDFSLIRLCHFSLIRLYYRAGIYGYRLERTATILPSGNKHFKEYNLVIYGELCHILNRFFPSVWGVEVFTVKQIVIENTLSGRILHPFTMA